MCISVKDSLEGFTGGLCRYISLCLYLHAIIARWPCMLKCLAYPPFNLRNAWNTFLSNQSSRDAAGDAIYSAIFDAAPELQHLFKRLVRVQHDLGHSKFKMRRVIMPRIFDPQSAFKGMMTWGHSGNSNNVGSVLDLMVIFLSHIQAGSRLD